MINLVYFINFIRKISKFKIFDNRIYKYKVIIQEICIMIILTIIAIFAFAQKFDFSDSEYMKTLEKFYILSLILATFIELFSTFLIGIYSLISFMKKKKKSDAGELGGVEEILKVKKSERGKIPRGRFADFQSKKNRFENFKGENENKNEIEFGKLKSKFGNYRKGRLNHKEPQVRISKVEKKFGRKNMQRMATKKIRNKKKLKHTQEKNSKKSFLKNLEKNSPQKMNTVKFHGINLNPEKAKFVKEKLKKVRFFF